MGLKRMNNATSDFSLYLVYVTFIFWEKKSLMLSTHTVTEQTTFNHVP